ncbi:MAG: heat-inducible transcriptional repressor HrcA [Microcoleaceae cyanobacterium MO_207.B10]|nr:heat-inducible transcriptional repressor HrcA [Microcoleaceae cyanobacterium MO_207.B10]
MSVQVKLNNRHQHILWATIRHYIATAEPVGSKSLVEVEEYNLSVSPATIRNGMSFLEKSGLLYQPHTSAGRVPSDSGYRIYVDQLMTPSENLAFEVEELLQKQLNGPQERIEAMLRGAAQMLATLSGYITLVTMPQTSTARLRHLQLVQVEPKKIMLIVVTNTYETHSLMMDLKQINQTISLDDSALQNSEDIDRELQILSNFLNSELRGRAIGELSLLDGEELDQDFEKYAELIKNLLENLSLRCQTPEYTRILISGIAEALRLPEFSQLQQVQTIIQLLEEEQEQLWPLIFEPATTKTGKQVTVRIGSENPLEPIQGCALVSAIYGNGPIPLGSVGVLGPTRMVYENAIALVGATADFISEALVAS